MAVFIIKSRKRGEYPVYVSDRDFERVMDYARFSGEKVKDYRSGKDVRDEYGYPRHVADYSRPPGLWHVVWKNGKIDAVATNVNIGLRRTKQMKLHEYIMGEIPRCKGVRHRDGDPLNNVRENLMLYQVYRTEDITHAKKGGKRADVCVGCKDENTCRKVATRKRILPHIA